MSVCTTSPICDMSLHYVQRRWRFQNAESLSSRPLLQFIFLVWQDIPLLRPSITSQMPQTPEQGCFFAAAGTVRGTYEVNRDSLLSRSCKPEKGTSSSNNPHLEGTSCEALLLKRNSLKSQITASKTNKVCVKTNCWTRTFKCAIAETYLLIKIICGI